MDGISANVCMDEENTIQRHVRSCDEKKDLSKEYDEENLKLKQIHYVPDKQLLKRRKSLSENPFGIVKRDMGVDYVLLKRICGVTAEMAFTYLAFNMKRAIVGCWKNNGSNPGIEMPNGTTKIYACFQSFQKENRHIVRPNYYLICVLFLVGKNQFYRPVLSCVPVIGLSVHLGLPYVQSTFPSVYVKWEFPLPVVLHNAVSP